jgi:hypothetical protein
MKQLQLFQGFQKVGHFQKVGQVEVEKAGKENGTGTIHDWAKILCIVKNYFLKHTWDTRIDHEEITQECMIYLLYKLPPKKCNAKYVQFHIQNFVNRYFLPNKENCFQKCLKTLYHDIENTENGEKQAKFIPILI